KRLFLSVLRPQTPFWATRASSISARTYLSHRLSRFQLIVFLLIVSWNQRLLSAGRHFLSEQRVCANFRRSEPEWHFFAGIAQLVEQLICNQQVVGSNPTAGF